MEPFSRALLLLPLLLAPSTAAAPAPGPAAQGADDAAEAAYRFLVALAEEELHARVATEAQRFLASHPGHARAAAARHRLAEALFALARFEEAAPHFSALLEADFELAAECALRLGECRLAAGDARAAAAALERALASQRAYLHAHAAQLLGEARLALLELPAAEAAYARALELEPAGEVAALARRGLAWCALRAGAHPVAEARARDFLARHRADPRAAELHFVLGTALLEQGRDAEALEAYAGVPAASELADEALRGAAFAQLALQRPLDAARTFAALLERHPQSVHAPEAALQRAAALLVADSASEALEALEHPAVGSGGEARLLRARALAAQGQRSEALAELERALAEPAGSTDAPELVARLELARGDVLLALERSAEAARAYESAGGPEALLLAAIVSSNAGHLAEAERLARGVLDLMAHSPLGSGAEAERRPAAGRRSGASPGGRPSGDNSSGDDGPAAPGARDATAARARLVLGEALLATERPAEAALPLQEAARALRGHDGALELRARSSHAWALHLAGDLAGAARGFGELAALEGDAPELEEAGLLEARALLEAGRTDEARAALRRHLERRPEGARAAEALLMLARAESGTLELERLLAEHPESPLRAAAWLELAERLLAAGDHGRASAAYRALLAEHAGDPGAPAARYGLAWCLRAMGEAEQAARELLPLIEADAAAPAEVPLELREAALELAVWCRIESGEAQGAARAVRALAALVLAPPAAGAHHDTEPAQLAAQDARIAALVACARAAARALSPPSAGDPAPAEDGAAAPDDAQPLRRGSLSQALALLEDLAARLAEPRAREELLLEGAWIALEAGGLETAEELAGRTLGANASSAGGLEVLYFLAHAREEGGAVREAARLYGLAAAPGAALGAEALYKQGFAWLALAEDELAAKSFRALCARHAGHELEGEARYLAGEALLRAGDAAGAVEELNAFRARHPRHEAMPRALFRLGLSHARLERHAEAAQALEELGRAAPDFEARAEAELWRGRALLGTGDERGARRALENVLARDRGQLADGARILLGRLELAGGRADEALSHLLKVALLSTHAAEIAEASFVAGRALEELGEPEQALARYESVLREHPGSAFAQAARERSAALRPRRASSDSETPKNQGASR